MNFFLILIAFCVFFVTVDAVYLKINTNTKNLTPVDTETYFLPSTPKEDYGLWPRLDPFAETPLTCTTEVDAQFIPSVSLYTIQNWYRAEIDYGDVGAFLLELHIIDLKKFVDAGFAANIWEHPKDCTDIFSRLEENLLKPLTRKLGNFIYQEFTIQENGILLEFRCKTRDDIIFQRYCHENNNFGCETSGTPGYRLCTAEKMLEIFLASRDQPNFNFF